MFLRIDFMHKFKRFFIKLWEVVKATADRFSNDEPIIYSAAIAFFTIFSLPSVLLIIVNVAGWFYSDGDVAKQLTSQIREMVGEDSGDQIAKILENAYDEESGIIASIIGIIIFLFSATVVFNFIQKALNSVWSVKPKPKRGALKFLIDRMLSFGIVLILGFLMMITLLLDALLNFFSDYVEEVLQLGDKEIMLAGNFLVSFTIVVVIFAMLFKLLPDVNIRWRDVGVGALVTAILFKIGEVVIGIVLSQTDIASTYGAAGSLAAILLWVFYSTVILMIGAEFTHVYTHKFGRDIKPNKHAIMVEVREVEKKD